jgi:hypothetical protein
VRRSVPLAATLLALAMTGCGPQQPQAPLPQAKKLDESLSGISTACGETYQLTAFPGKREPYLATLEATAISDSQKLTSVYARNPAWIYQGETVGQIVKDSISALRSCGLERAATALARGTKSRSG